jgi:hypothetical protein
MGALIDQCARPQRHTARSAWTQTGEKGWVHKIVGGYCPFGQGKDGCHCLFRQGALARTDLIDALRAERMANIFKLLLDGIRA